MPHEIEVVNGVARMAYAGDTPWHGLGQRITDEAKTSIPLMIEAAGLNWEVEKVPLITQDTHQEVKRWATRRISDQKILGDVGQRYTILQNQAAFDWFKPFLEAGEAEFEAAGSLFGGSRIWVLAKIKRDPLIIRENDRVEKYILLAHGHDGLLVVNGGLTPIRVVCNNTLSAAMGDEESQLIRIRHTQSLGANLEAVRDTINTINERLEACGEVYKRLANKAINQTDVVKYVHVVFDLPEPGLESKQATKIVDRIKELVRSGMGNTGETYWDAYNGITQYLSYETSRTQNNRLNNLWFGRNKQLNDKALSVALEFADSYN